jgi:hypothetical protein
MAKGHRLAILANSRPSEPAKGHGWVDIDQFQPLLSDPGIRASENYHRIPLGCLSLPNGHTVAPTNTADDTVIINDGDVLVMLDMSNDSSRNLIDIVKFIACACDIC